MSQFNLDPSVVGAGFAALTSGLVTIAIYNVKQVLGQLKRQNGSIKSHEHRITIEEVLRKEREKVDERRDEREEKMIGTLNELAGKVRIISHNCAAFHGEKYEK